ncbi:carboxypeptidase-like regulatory domain-containing protein [Marinilabilia sp.]|uniref:carboxypeptidase-like regulatory domain-containing protein n=1 Tax=Marinilabilia sp. TaxID=2021252 RepID=UPI0025B8FE72|nr:carboxypeptidase-like regulatory domain-containing protein [Marinilabilia sp.]
MRKGALNRGFILVFGLLLVSSCAREAYNISWEGVVVDQSSGQPVQNARILATSSYQANIDETGSQKNYTVSDENGQFSIAFRRGFGITVRTSASGFLSGLDYKVVKKPDIRDTIFLSPYPFDASLVVRKIDETSFASSVPFIREKHVIDGGFSGSEKITKWGFDFLTGINTLNLDSADVWIEINQKSGKIVLNASEKGGIYPVVKTDPGDFVMNVTKAPESGYLKSYVFAGDEAGFFILCRNGVHVAKMIPEDKICILSYWNSDGSRVKETGIRFDYLFQPNLQNRLYFPVSASADGVEFSDETVPRSLKSECDDIDSN